MLTCTLTRPRGIQHSFRSRVPEGGAWSSVATAPGLQNCWHSHGVLGPSWGAGQEPRVPIAILTGSSGLAVRNPGVLPDTPRLAHVAHGAIARIPPHHPPTPSTLGEEMGTWVLHPACTQDLQSLPLWPRSPSTAESRPGRLAPAQGWGGHGVGGVARWGPMAEPRWRAPGAQSS